MEKVPERGKFKEFQERFGASKTPKREQIWLFRILSAFNSNHEYDNSSYI